MSIFKVILLPRRYRIPVLVGLVVGFSQGVILIFFNMYVCRIADTEAIRAYCKKDVYDPEEGFLALMLLNILTIGPAIFFLLKLERILLHLSIAIEYGRVKLVKAGTIAAIITLAIVQIIVHIRTTGVLYDWKFYFIEGILMFYTIFIQAATLGPVLYCSDK